MGMRAPYMVRLVKTRYGWSASIGAKEETYVEETIFFRENVVEAMRAHKVGEEAGRCAAWYG